MIQLPYQQGRYILRDEIARGGMAVVYLAKQIGSGGCLKDVAVKRLLPQWSENHDFVTMLIDEAKVLVQLQHQNIVQMFELGVDQGVYFLAMEYVAGIDLRLLLQDLWTRQMRLPEPFAFYVTLEILKGLTFAHRQVDEQGESLELVHRDISPQNILLSLHGEVKIADFGIAKGTHRRGVTIGGIKGKFAYMSPEQARGGLIDQRTDIFAVGVLLYEMLVGRPLFDAPNEMLVLERIRQARLPNGWEQHVHPALRAILRRALAAELPARYATASMFLAELSRVVGDHGWHTNGVEFAQYLHEILPAQVAKIRQRGRSELSPLLVQQTLEQTRGYTNLGGLRRSSARLARGLGMVALLALLSMGPSHGRYSAMPRLLARTLPVARVPVPPPVLIQDDRPATPVAMVVGPEVPTVPRTATVVTAASGTLVVRVRPWGYVSIPGVVANREAPLQLAVRAGEYLVRVRGEDPRGVQARARVASGRATVCHATTMGKPTMWCR